VLFNILCYRCSLVNPIHTDLVREEVGTRNSVKIVHDSLHASLLTDRNLYFCVDSSAWVASQKGGLVAIELDIRSRATTRLRHSKYRTKILDDAGDNRADLRISCGVDDLELPENIRRANIDVSNVVVLLAYDLAEEVVIDGTINGGKVLYVICNAIQVPDRQAGISVYSPVGLAWPGVTGSS